MCLEIILKVGNNQGFTLSLKNSFFEKSQGEEGKGGSNWHPSLLSVNVNLI